MGQSRKLLSGDDRLADWRRWIERAYNEALSQGWRYKMFRLMRGVAVQNAELQRTGGFFLQWAANNYVAASAMALRRELDGRSGAENLFHLLHEMRQQPEALSRARFRSTWTGRLEHYTADTAFDDLRIIRSPDDRDADHIDPSLIDEDLERLKSADDVLEHVQSTIAHRMASREDAPAPTYAELHEAHDVVWQVIARYYRILTHKVVMFREPTEIGFSVYAPFEFAWVPDRETFDYGRCEQDPIDSRESGEA
jgi:hypothetical protein